MGGRGSTGECTLIVKFTVSSIPNRAFVVVLPPPAAVVSAPPPPCLQLEWPATWCFLSVAMCLLALGSELYSVHRSMKHTKAVQHAAAADAYVDIKNTSCPKQE